MLCEKMSLLCSFSPFVMGKFFLRKGKCYLRNVNSDTRFLPLILYLVAGCVSAAGVPAEAVGYHRWTTRTRG